jgi:CheY-like chemotaxis protein
MGASYVEELRILSAEDDPTESLLLRRAFLKAGIKAALDIVSDGQQAVDWLRGHPPFGDRTRHPLPTLLLLDLKMPRMDGFQVIEWLRQQPGLRRLLVVVLSNSEEVQDVNRAYDMGANSFVRKPTHFKGLQAMAEDMERYWFKRSALPVIVPD